MNNTIKPNNPVPYYYKLPSGRLVPFVSQPTRRFTQHDIANLELMAKIGFDRKGMPLK